MTTAHFRYFQAERLNVININTSRTLTAEISGSVIILDNSQGEITITLPKPESGLHFKFIIKTNDDNTSISNDIVIKSTTDDVNSSEIIYFTGLSGNGETPGTEYLSGIVNKIKTSSVTIDNLVVSGDRLEFITDGNNWFGTGLTKHRSLKFSN